MLTYDIETIEDGAGRVVEAHTALCHCSDGGQGDIFYVFWPEGLNHLHIACGQCSQHHCPFGLCAIPLNPPPPPEEP